MSRANEPKGFYKMRFIGKPDGVLMKRAPGNYIHGQIYQQPYHMCKFPYWELVEEAPTLVAPPPDDGDSVFEETVFIPDESEEDVEVDIILDEAGVDDDIDKYINNDTPATIEPFTAYRVTQTEDGVQYTNIPPIKKHDITTTEPIGEVTLSSSDDPVELSRDELKQKLDDAGVEYDKRTRTSILKKMVDELEPQE